MCQQANLIKVHTVSIVSNSLLPSSIKKNIDHMMLSVERQDIANCGTYINQSFSESSLVAAFYPEKLVDTLQVIT